METTLDNIFNMYKATEANIGNRVEVRTEKPKVTHRELVEIKVVIPWNIIIATLFILPIVVMALTVSFFE